MDNDELSKRLNDLLSSPESLSMIGQLLGSMGGSPVSETDSPDPPDPPLSAESPFQGMDLTRLLPLLSGLSGLSAETDESRLLLALKPYLHGKRAGRLSGAMQMVRLSKVLPLLTGGGE